MSNYLITSALPYINGIKHLGNLIGSMLPADVYARHLRQQGENVLFICGTDEHGTPAELAAQAKQTSVADYCAQMYDVQKAIYEQFNISFDYFGRSSDPENHDTTQAVFTALDANGFIETRSIQQIYSPADERFLPDRYVVGTCPHCNYARARGDQCDGCGKLLDPVELINPRSAVSGSDTLEVRDVEHLFLKLPALSDEVRTWVDSHPHWPNVTKGIANKWLTEGLQERCISRDLSWGVKIPKPGFEHQVFYVWFDAPIAYISMTKAWAKEIGDPDAWKAWWQPAAETNGSDDDAVHYVQFMAKDNVPFHAIFWPAMLLGTREPWKLADDIKGFNWLTYEGGKFSTSEQRGVFTDVALTLFPADWWRYYLIANAPESDDADFNFDHFASVINKDLADILGNFVNRNTALIKKYFDGLIPASDHPADATLLSTLQQHVTDLDTALREQRFRQSAQLLRTLWALGNEYITEQAPWKLAKTDLAGAGHVLRTCLHLIRLFAIVGYSFMPTTAQQLFTILGLDGAPSDYTFEQALDFDYLPVGAALQAHGNLFEKIDEDAVAQLHLQFAGQA